MKKPISKAKRREVASEYLEDAVAELLEAHEYLSSAQNMSEQRNRRIYLLAKARQYVRALDALSRVG